MKLLFVSYEWPEVTDCGGSGRINNQLRERLLNRGHSVPLLTDFDDGHFATFPFRYHREMARQIRDEQPDVVFACNTLPTAVGLPHLCSRHDVPLVTKTMGSDVFNPNRFTRVRPLLGRVNGYIFDAADAIVSPSQALADHVDGHEPTVIPNGIDPSSWTWRSHDLHDPFRILTVARLQPVKQIGLGIEAVQKLRARGYNTTYRVVGDGPKKATLEDEYGHHEWLEFAGWADDVQPHYHWTDVFLLPSAHESFGLVLLEAVASGTPVVSTDTGGQKTVLSKQPQPGRLSQPTAYALADGLEIVATDYREYQSATRGYCEHFSLELMTDAFERLFTRLAETRSDSMRTTAENSRQTRQPTQPDNTGQPR